MPTAPKNAVRRPTITRPTSPSLPYVASQSPKMIIRRAEDDDEEAGQREHRRSPQSSTGIEVEASGSTTTAVP